MMLSEVSLDVSLWVQILTGLVGLQGSFVKLPPEHAILKEALQLETAVQFIEFAFYAKFLKEVSLEHMATVRYYDWMLTTPMMLLSTIVVMKYEGLKAEKKSTAFTLRDFIKDHASDIQAMFLANWGMLLTGYLGEREIIPQEVSLALGFGFFAASFSIVKKYADASDTGKKLYVFLVVVWSLYGVVFPLDPELKNTALNTLDIIAKNFFGLWLYKKVMDTRM
jgi:hypothetical protein